MNPSGPVAVLGATGQVGGVVLRELTRRRLPVRPILRNRSDAHTAATSRVVTEWDEAELSLALAGCSSAFVMVPLVEQAERLGYTLHAALETAGVQRVVRLSVLSGVIDDGLALGRLHGALDADLSARDVHHAILRPDSFMQNLLGSAAAIAQGRLINATGRGRMALIDAQDIGACAAALLSGEAPWPDHPVDLTGPELLSHEEIAKRIGHWLCRPVIYEDLSPDALRDLLLDVGVPAFLADIFSELAAWTRRADRSERLTTGVADLLGRPPGSLERFLESQAPAFSDDAASP